MKHKFKGSIVILALVFFVGNAYTQNFLKLPEPENIEYYKRYELTGVDFQSNRLKPESKIILDSLYENYLKGNTYNVLIVGHCYNYGSNMYEEDMTKKLASKIKYYWKEEYQSDRQICYLGTGRVFVRKMFDKLENKTQRLRFEIIFVPEEKGTKSLQTFSFYESVPKQYRKYYIKK